MRWLPLLAPVAVLLSVATSVAASNPAGFTIHRGVNVSHWLSQCPKDADKASYITEADFEFLHRIGYDHVRLPIDETELWTPDGAQIGSSFRLLTSALDWCARHDLRAIVDLHTVRTHHFNSEFGKNTLWTDPAAQARFLRVWEELITVLHQYPVSAVAYEIMNEPVADNPDDWNALIARTLALIRQREPQRVVVIGSNRWQGAGTFPALAVPAGDPNLILSFHDYEPFAFTHHTASWTNIREYRGPVHYPGATVAAGDYAAITDPELKQHLSRATEAWDRARMIAHMQPAIDRARQLKLPLYCGEFGCMPSVPRQDRLAWYADMIAALEGNGVAWANWDYKSNEFGILPYDFRQRKPGPADEDLIRVLLKR